MRRAYDSAARTVMRRSRQSGEGGFTLLEVIIALAILAISLTVFLQTQAASLANAGRARNLTIATLLARSKMIDIEQKLVDEGFTLGNVQEEGDFEEDGHAEIKWSYNLDEIELELGSLSSLCESLSGEDETRAGACDSLVASLGAPLEGMVGEIARSVRLVELKVTWPDGHYQESMTLHALLTRDDFGFATPTAGSGSTPGSPFPGSAGTVQQR